MSSPDKIARSMSDPKVPPKSPGAGSQGSQQFSRSGSAGTTGVANAPSRGRLDRQTSRDHDGAARRRSAYRRMSSFDIPHINSFISEPDIKRLEAIDLKSVNVPLRPPLSVAGLLLCYTTLGGTVSSAKAAKQEEKKPILEGEFAQVPWWTSQRFQLAIICFFGFVVLYAQRVNLSIAIVSMVDHQYLAGLEENQTVALTYNASANLSGISLTTPAPSDELCPDLTKTARRGEFRWDKKLQGLLLGGFFWGYMTLQVFGGAVSEKFGAKKVIAFGMVPVAVLNMLSPVCARANPYLFLVVRILVGVGESVMYPAAQALWSRWSPPNERSRLIGFSYAGGQFGNAIVFPIGGFLCAYGFDGGWPSVFYVIGACGGLWCVVWILFAHDSPDENKRISELEKKYIKYSIGDRAKRKRGSTPWKAIFTSKAMWAIIIAHMCGNFGAYMLLTQIPTYMKEVLKFDIKANGVYSMLPYLTFWFFITVSGMVADFLISREILTVGRTRKLMAAIGMLGPGAFLIGTGFMECTQATGAVAMLTLAVGLCGFHFSGYFINHGDIAPPFAGTMFGITNTAATVPGIIAPYVVAAMTPNRSREEWQAAFYVAAAIYFFGAAFFAIFGEGEIQPWAKIQDEAANKDQDEADVGFDLHEIHETVHEEDENEAEDKAAEKMLRGANGDKK